MNVQMSVCRRMKKGREKKEKGHVGLSTLPDVLVVASGMSSRATIADSNGGARPREKYAVKNDNVEARRRYTRCVPSHTSPKSPRTGKQYQRAQGLDQGRDNKLPECSERSLLPLANSRFC